MAKSIKNNALKAHFAGQKTILRKYITDELYLIVLNCLFAIKNIV